MPRTLAVSRVRVRAGGEAEYLASVRGHARRAARRGWGLGVLRPPAHQDAYLEFSESRSRETHRAVAERPADERALEARIRAVAEYEPGAWELWEEIR